jgi:DNA-directed RNA polymerase subunit K/omega
VKKGKALFLPFSILNHTILIMARITVEDCLDKVSNRFEKSKTAFQGSKATARNATREIVTALREIAEGKVRRQNSDEE